MTLPASNCIQQCVVRDEWLSRIFGKDVYRVSVNSNVVKEHASAIREHVKSLWNQPVFAYAKVPVSDTRSSLFLEDLGFRLVDTNVAFERKLEKLSSSDSAIPLRFAEPGDEGQVCELARKNFSFSRFHLDPEIDSALANKIKEEWARGYFKGRPGYRMIVALDADKIAGFLLVFTNQSNVLVIDLVAVDQVSRGKGIARAMIRFAENHNTSCERVRVGTQLANAPSLCLYEKMGFQYRDAAYVFHFHNQSRSES